VIGCARPVAPPAGGWMQLVSDDVNVHVDMVSGNLTVLTTDEADLGEYRCVASNGISSVSATAKLYLPPHTGSQ